MMRCHSGNAASAWRQAEAFDARNHAWMETLEALGHPLLSLNRGETVITIEPKA